jgi:hypothetical protein
MKNYCVYLVKYRGNKLPPFYIGSTTIDKINNGYLGSVSSKKYSTIYYREVAENRHLFSISIISVHATRREAIDKEYKLQKAVNANKSPMYVNMSLAYGMPNEFACMIGENHVHKGKTGEEVPWYGMSRSIEAKENYKKSKLGKNNPMTAMYIITNEMGIEVYRFRDNFYKTLSGFGFSKTEIYVLYCNIKSDEPIQIKPKKKTGPAKIIPPKLIGWKCIACKNDYQSKHANLNKGRRWWIDTRTLKTKYEVSCPGVDYVLGRKLK